MLNQLSETQSEVIVGQGENRLAGLLKVLSDPTRLAIFDVLMDGVQCNCEIAERLGISLSLISHHLSVLRKAGLVESERDPEDARWIYYSVDRDALRNLRQALNLLLDPERIHPRRPSCGPRGGCSVVPGSR